MSRPEFSNFEPEVKPQHHHLHHSAPQQQQQPTATSSFSPVPSAAHSNNNHLLSSDSMQQSPDPNGSTNDALNSSTSSRRSLHERRSESQPSTAGRLSIQMLDPLDFAPEDDPDGSPTQHDMGGGQQGLQAHFNGLVELSAGQAMPPNTRRQPGNILVLSYNILASRYALTDKYPTCPRWALAEGYRVSNIINQIREVNADIMVFQELPVNLTLANENSPEFGVALENMGYSYFHTPITARTVGNNSNNGGSACASVATSVDSASGTGSGPPAPIVVAASGLNNGTAATTPAVALSTGVSPATSGASLPLMGNGIQAYGMAAASSSSAASHEGVGIYWRTARFEKMEEIPIKFNMIASRDPKLRPEDRSRVCVKSHNVASIVVLRDRATGGVLIVAGTHAHFEFSRPHCQLWQAVRLVEEVERIKDVFEDASVILAGDWNSEPWKPTFQFMTTGQSPDLAPFHVAPIGGTECASHSLRLGSAYTNEYFSSFPSHVTAMSDGYEGVIDHIFYSLDGFACAAVGRLDAKQEVPNKSIPSDHYPVVAELVPLDAPAVEERCSASSPSASSGRLTAGLFSPMAHSQQQNQYQ